MSLRTIACAFAVAATALSATADAAPRTENHTGSAACDAASSGYFSSAIRERSTGIANGGTTSQFVTCGLPGFGNAANSISPAARSVSLYFTNDGSATVTVSCTASEALMGTAATQATRSTIVPPGNTQQSLRFHNHEVNPSGAYWRTPAISCSLPAGAGISTLWYVYDI